MQKIWSIIRKDTLLRFSSPVEWVFFLILPMLFTVVLAAATGVYSDGRLALKVMDYSQPGSTEQLFAALGESDLIRLDPLASKGSFEEAELGTADSLLLVAPDFTSQGGRLRLLLAPNTFNGMSIHQELSRILTKLNAEQEIVHFVVSQAQKLDVNQSDLASIEAETSRQAYQLLHNAPQRIAYADGGTPFEVRYDPNANSASGQMITWVTVNLLGISQFFAQERRLGTLNRLLSSPTSRSTYLSGTILGQVLTALVQMGLLLGISSLFMKINWGKDPLALVVLLLAFAFSIAALGTWMGSIIKSAAQANGLSVTLGMMMSLLGGCWFPRELFPKLVQNITLALPSTWAMQGMLDLSLSGGGLLDILPKIAVLFGFALLFFGLAAWRFRKAA